MSQADNDTGGSNESLYMQVPPDMLSMEVTTETNPDERETQRDLDSRYNTLLSNDVMYTVHTKHVAMYMCTWLHVHMYMCTCMYTFTLQDRTPFRVHGPPNLHCHGHLSH